MKLLKQYSALIQKITTFMFLHIAYYLGIGVTSLVGKLVSFSFLPKATKSTWIKHKTGESMRTMY